MPATYKRAAVERALKAKGFRPKESHHRYFVYYTEEGIKSPVRTKTSRGKGAADISSSLISQMAKQCKLRTAEFRDLVDCTMSQAEYEALLTLKSES